MSSASGVLDETQYSFSTRFEDSIGTNPEELIAAAREFERLAQSKDPAVRAGAYLRLARNFRKAGDVEEALELVIRSLGVQFATVPGLAGAATTADGEAVVALDLNLLIADVASSRQMQLSVSKEKADAKKAKAVAKYDTAKTSAAGALALATAAEAAAEAAGFQLPPSLRD